LPTRGKYGQGSTVYSAKNPDFGAIFTYHIKEVPKTKKQIRKKKEKELFKEGKPIPQPTDAELREEKQEFAPYITFTIADASGTPVRIFHKSASKGISRENWDLKYQSTRSVDAKETWDPKKDNGSGILAMPGTYSVSLSMTAGGETKPLAGPVEFQVIPLENTTLPAADRQAMVAFNAKVAEFSRVMRGTEDYAEKLLERTNDLLLALNSVPGGAPDLMKQARALQLQLDAILNVTLNRRTGKPSDEENPPAPVPLNDRLGKVTWASYSSTGDPTQTAKTAFAILEEEFPPVYDQVKQIGEVELPALEAAAEAIGAPVTPGRLPVWKR
ncbi:hypothetical protein ACFLS7_06800, partial [Bacteroidota bacterium]